MGEYDRMKWKDQCDQEMNDYTQTQTDFLKFYCSFQCSDVKWELIVDHSFLCMFSDSHSSRTKTCLLKTV